MKKDDHYDYILDAYAILAYLGNEPGGKRVRDTLTLAQQTQISIGLSIINLGEVMYTVEREQGLPKAHETLALIQSLPIAIISANDEVVFSAAHIKANFRLSYADAFAVATTDMFGGKLMTGDPEYEVLENKSVIAIEWLPKKTKSTE